MTTAAGWQGIENTDRELWREREGDYYADSVHVTRGGGIGINCGGTVYVMPLREWHALASERAARERNLPPPPGAAAERAGEAVAEATAQTSMVKRYSYLLRVGDFNGDDKELSDELANDKITTLEGAFKEGWSCGAAMTRAVLYSTERNASPAPAQGCPVCKCTRTHCAVCCENGNLSRPAQGAKVAELERELAESRRAPAAGDALERANEERVRLHNELLAARRDAERMEDALHQIKQWSLAYPLSVFPEPDFKRVAEVLKAAGITLDAVSASNMRHVITRVQAIVDAALRAEGEGK